MLKKTHLIITLLLINCSSIFSQANLPTSYNGPWLGTSPPTGWSWNMTGGDNPGANFNGIGRQMQIDFGCQPYSISFDITPNTLNSSVSKVIIVEEFVGGSWVTLATYSWNGSVASPIGLGSLGAPATLSQTLLFNSTATSVRFNMTVRDAGVGNYGISNVSVVGDASCGSCSASSSVPNDACYQQVITDDPYCCDTDWDGTCQAAYDACNAPPPPPPGVCLELGFDDEVHTFTGTHGLWTTMRGRNNVAGPFTIEGPIVNEPIISNQFNEYHDLRPGSDPSAGFCYFPDGTIPVPNGSQTVMKLGAYQQIGMDASGMTATFTVTEPYLVYSYILGFENSGHTVNNRGFCTFEIRDNGGVVLPCGSFQVYENGPTENWTFHTAVNDVWLMDDWRTVTLDVSNYVGQALTIEVWVADCQEGAHSGFGYFDFECLSTATPDCSVSPSPLPVEFHSLTSNCNNNRSALTWTTESERDNSHFTVWESTDGLDFNAIGDVTGMGTTTSSHNYSFEIANYTNETKYYRVSQTDFNGTETIHETVSFSGCDNTPVNVHYADGFVTVSGTDIYQISVVDAAGRLVKESNSKEAMQKISIERLDSGIYFVAVYQKGMNPKIVKIFNY